MHVCLIPSVSWCLWVCYWEPHCLQHFCSWKKYIFINYILVVATYYPFLFKYQPKFHFFHKVICIYWDKIDLSWYWITIPIYNTSLIVLILWILYCSHYTAILPSILDSELLKVQSIFCILYYISPFWTCILQSMY